MNRGPIGAVMERMYGCPPWKPPSLCLSHLWCFHGDNGVVVPGLGRFDVVDEATGRTKTVRQRCNDASREECVREVRQLMKESLQSRWEGVRTKWHMMATLLDPRFKELGSWGLTVEEATRTRQDVLRELTNLYGRFASPHLTVSHHLE